MDQGVVYTDYCSEDMTIRIKNELDLDIVPRIKEEDWNVNDAMGIIADPRLVLAVVNRIDEIAIMEIALLNFMCKPVLVTARAVSEYPIVEQSVDHVDTNCNLRDPVNSFISWYKFWRGYDNEEN